ncbi:isochorismatase family protein [Nemania sp. FL0916]|nr:isochorismatase family protein [Nemania sp. FL0916]
MAPSAINSAANVQAPSIEPSSASPIVVGSSSNFWLFTDRDGFDMTHPATPSSQPVYPRVTMKTTNGDITIAPSKTALVIIDMQNFFLSPAVGRVRGEGHEAEETLLKLGIPAARKAGIQIIWVNWGISEDRFETLPPNLWRTFGWDINQRDDADARPERKHSRGIGSPLGNVKLEDGTEVDAGRVLMPDQWNTSLHGELADAYQEGLKAAIPDVWINKERMSGFWGPSPGLEAFLRKQGITTLLFTGVNTDQCVLATVQDASNTGFDTILLEDGCGTRSPDYARKTVHYNCQKGWGFISTCAALAHGVDNMVKNRDEES